MWKYIIWYGLQLKVWCKKKSCWLEICGFILLLMLVMNINLPEKDNMKVGLCSEDGKYAASIIEHIMDRESSFDFEEYTSSEKLEKDVVAGKIECGFVFNNGFEKKIKQGDTDNIIDYICTPLTQKGFVVKEVIFSEIFKKYSENILEQSVPEIYGSQDEYILKQLKDKNAEYEQGDKYFNLQIKEISQKKETQKHYSIYMVQGIVGILVFVIMLMEGVTKFHKGSRSINKALTLREQRFFELINYIAITTPQGIVGLVAIFVVGDSRSIIEEIIALILLMGISAVFVLVLTRLFKDEINFITVGMTIILLNLIICPIFIDISQYVQGITYVRFFSPIGIYLNL